MLGVKEIEPNDLKELIDAGEKVRLVDVRSAAEYNQGIIEGGEFLPLHTLPVRLNDFIEAEDETLVFYCRSGVRSAQACMFASQNSDLEPLNLRGGIIHWYRSNLPVIPPHKGVA